MKNFLPSALLLAVSSSAFANIEFSNHDGTLGEPSTYTQFQDILATSKLQISDPDGKRSNKVEVAENSDFSGIVNDYFYVDKDTEALVFKMKNDHLRNELRVHENFRTDLENEFHTLSAEVVIVDPERSMQESDSKQDEITFLQVHNKGLDQAGTHNVPHPLLRVVWKRDSAGIKGHFWAIVKNNAVICKGLYAEKHGDKAMCQSNEAYKHYDLGKAPSKDITDFDITVGNKLLAIDVNGQRLVEHDIDYWRHLLTFYKAGVYNQFTHGMSEAHFYKLDYTVSD
ncbi:polysaccharide lyase family 7 protein [Vibrio agarivorans]|uniref:polysaccharide lyase family 7 protein n=1 Tax=Vibrio agarivorans TaxID=153622 RepID=UPI002232A4A1|nr:polysaccharide lyase family 7 protein [Vibrio agarivorans]MDN3663459.1 polysaccharide lyase family 7 protein [Vibrio agarivorans]